MLLGAGKGCDVSPSTLLADAGRLELLTERDAEIPAQVTIAPMDA